MKFAGEQHFECGPADLWARLTDMTFMSRIIPDVEKIERVDASGFTCKVRPRFSFLTGSLQLTFTIIESVEPDRLTVRSISKGIGSAVVVEEQIHLAADNAGTTLRWTGAIVSRDGLLKPVSSALLEAAAHRVIDSFWQRFHAALTQGGQSTGAVEPA